MYNFIKKYEFVFDRMYILKFGRKSKIRQEQQCAEAIMSYYDR